MRLSEILEPTDRIYYHGTQATFDGVPNESAYGLYGPGVYLYTTFKNASYFAGQNGSVKEYRISDGKLANDNEFSNAIELAKSEGYQRTASRVRAHEILRERGYMGIKDGLVLVIFSNKDVLPVVKESATAGATGSASVATAVGGLGAGFDPNGDQGIYQKKKKPLLIKRVTESAETNLGMLCTIKTNFPDADFWIVRRGDISAVGKPTKEFSEEKIGVKVERTDILDPQYLYYAIENIFNRGYFRSLATGSLRLVNITISQVKSIGIG